jgi:UDP-glucose 4-epimerase
MTQESGFEGKTLLITGGTGSFGNVVIRHFLRSKIGEIRVFSRDEKKQDDMRHHLKDNRIRFYIGDVRDRDSIHSAMRGVDFVFSAAALKQVPSCEFYPLEAVRTNILGTENTLNAAIANGVSRVIVLSTDKAVYPINAMGMSKALMEKVAVAKARDLGPQAKTRICVTRYGNVMASRGSVIPVFMRQIKAREPLTVTDPEMTRFMMTLEQAVDLVLFAFANGLGGDTFVQKSPAATMGQLAAVMNAVFKGQSEIRVIGTRHGEKRHETLLTREEMVRADDLGQYFRVASDMRDLNYGKFLQSGENRITEAQDYTSENTHRLTDPELTELLGKVDYRAVQLSEM